MFVDAEIGHRLQRRGQLAGAAVHQQQIGARRVLAGFLLLGQAREAAAQHLLHHAVSSPGTRSVLLMLNLRLLVLLEALGTGHDHCRRPRRAH